MSSHDDETNWRQSLERLGQAALDLVTSLAGRSGEQATGSGTTVTESREVSGFTQVKLLGFGTLNISQTGTESLTISAYDDVLPHLTAEVTNGVLELGVTPRLSMKSLRHVDYTLTVKNLDGITLAGAGRVRASDIQTSSLNVAISGAGDMTISGAAQSQTVRISGAGNYNGQAFQTATAEVTITGAGNAQVNATQSLDATVSGVGGVTYSGSPQVSQRISGVGSVRHA